MKDKLPKAVNAEGQSMHPEKLDGDQERGKRCAQGAKAAACYFHGQALSLLWNNNEILFCLEWVEFGPVDLANIDLVSQCSP